MKFTISLVGEEGALPSIEQDADGFNFTVDSGVFGRSGTAVFYVRRSGGDQYDVDNIAIYRGVTRVVPFVESGA